MRQGELIRVLVLSHLTQYALAGMIGIRTDLGLE
jgi:hypothetical protein